MAKNKKITLDDVSKIVLTRALRTTKVLIIVPVPKEHSLSRYFGSEITANVSYKRASDHQAVEFNFLKKFLDKAFKDHAKLRQIKTSSMAEFNNVVSQLGGRDGMRKRSYIAFEGRVLPLNRYFSNQMTRETLPEDLGRGDKCITLHKSKDLIVGMPLSTGKAAAIPFIERSGEKAGELQWMHMADLQKEESANIVQSDHWTTRAYD